MPIYEYRRPDGTTFEVLQSMSEDPLTEDPETGVPVTKVLHAPSIHFKGSGFYNTDYGKKTKSAAKGDSSEQRQRLQVLRDEVRVEVRVQVGVEEVVGAGVQVDRSPRSPPPHREAGAAGPVTGRLRRHYFPSSFSTASAFSASDTTSEPPGPQPRQSGLSTLVSSELPVIRSVNRPSSPGPFMSLLIAFGAYQAMIGRRKNEVGRQQAAAQARHDLLLAGRAVQVVLARGAGVLAHAGEAQRGPPVQPVLALAQVEALVEVVELGRADLRLVVHRHAADRVDQVREVLEVDLDHVVDLQVVAEERPPRS